MSVTVKIKQSTGVSFEVSTDLSRTVLQLKEAVQVTSIKCAQSKGIAGYGGNGGGATQRSPPPPPPKTTGRELRWQLWTIDGNSTTKTTDAETTRRGFELRGRWGCTERPEAPHRLFVCAQLRRMADRAWLERVAGHTPHPTMAQGPERSREVHESAHRSLILNIV